MVKPFETKSKFFPSWITRTKLPILTTADPDGQTPIGPPNDTDFGFNLGRQSGLGDLVFISIFNHPTDWGSWGIGPCLDFEGCFGSRFKLTEFNMYPTFSYLDDVGATYAEFEFASRTELGWLEMENRTVLNVADLPSAIALGAANPNGDPTKGGVRAQGFGDILSGFFFSPRGSHQQQTHLGLGLVFTFPTATNEILGSAQYTAGPGAHFSTEKGRLTTGFFIIRITMSPRHIMTPHRRPVQ